MTTDNQNTELTILVEQPQQLSLLQDVTSSLTNTQSLRLWDSLVNAVFDDQKIVQRVADKFLETSTVEIEFEGETVEIVRYPARLKSETGEIDVFPMKKDYKVLEALIKLAVDQASTAFYRGDGVVLSVKASYYRIYQVFKNATGKASLSYKQIEEALEVLSLANTDFHYKGLKIRGALISSFTQKADADLKKSEFLLTFHPIISRIVLMGGFREANLQRILSAKDMITSFMYKKFVHNFTQASKSSYYHFSLLTTMKEIPQLAKWKRMSRKIERMTETLDKLVSDGVVLRYEVDPRYSEGAGQNKVVDAVYKVWFTKEFIQEQINANKKGKPSDQRVTIDGRVVPYPHHSNFKSHNEYIKELELWHSLGEDKKQNIIGKVFDNPPSRSK